MEARASWNWFLTLARGPQIPLEWGVNVRPLILICSLLVLAACASRNPARVDYCLAALTGLETGDAKLLVTEILGENETIDIRYRRDGDETGHDIVCRYEGSATALGQLNLASVTLDGESLGPGRLAFLKGYWLKGGRAFSAKARIVRPEMGYFTVSPGAGQYLQSALSAIPIAAVYMLLALGFALIHGVTGRMNIAHGEFSTVGAYAGYMGFMVFGAMAVSLGIAAAMVFAAIASGCAGWLTMRAVFMPLSRRNGQMLLVASAGLILVYEEATRLSHASRELWLPPILSSRMVLSSPPYAVTVTMMQIAIALFAALAVGTVFAIMRFTRFGLAWRAVADDTRAASLMGLDPTMVLSVSAVMSSCLAGGAGLVILLGYGNASYSMGLMLSVKAMVAALIGGTGSIGGAVLGALVLVAVETGWVMVFGGAYRDAAVFAILIGLLTLAPNGLFGLARK